MTTPRGQWVWAACYCCASVLEPRVIDEPTDRFCWRVGVHQETAVAATLTFQKAHPLQLEAVPTLKYQRLYIRAEIHMRPGTDKEVPQRPPRSACCGSPPMTSCATSRAQLPPRTHPNHTFCFASIPVSLTLCQG